MSSESGTSGRDGEYRSQAVGDLSLRSYLVRRATLPAAIGAFIFWWWSLTPTLLPRGWVAQGVVSALSAASGYMIGAILGWILHRLRPILGAEQWPAARRQRAWRIVTWVAGAIAIIGLVLWVIWQNDHRKLVLLDDMSPLAVLPMLIVTKLVALILLFVGRVITWLVRRLERFTSRFVPTWVAVAVTAVVVVALGITMTSRIGDRFVDWSRDQFGGTDQGTESGIAMPTSPLVSGSPDSLVPWDTLGLQGRTFVATAPAVDELAQFAGPEVGVMEPIRIYAGLRSANTAAGRAQLVVEELNRTGGFDREVLVVVTVTGTGWVDPDAVIAIEYMYGGDTAIVGMQYSYLPSWISFLVDGEVATAAAQAMNAAISEAYLTLPEADRPRLVLFAESLGSLGSEQAVAQEDIDASLDVLTAVPEGALYSGPTYGNPIWRQLVEARQPTSPVWQPSYDEGATVRVGNNPTDFAAADDSWGPARVGYLHHPSDPVGYWNFSLLWRPPGWTSEPIGAGVSPRAQWFPVVTFWQTVADLIAGFSTDPGFGHNYASEFVAGWAAVAAPPGWTAPDTARLQEYLQPTE